MRVEMVAHTVPPLLLIIELAVIVCSSQRHRAESKCIDCDLQDAIGVLVNQIRSCRSWRRNSYHSPIFMKANLISTGEYIQYDWIFRRLRLTHLFCILLEHRF